MIDRRGRHYCHGAARSTAPGRQQTNVPRRCSQAPRTVQELTHNRAGEDTAPAGVRSQRAQRVPLTPSGEQMGEQMGYRDFTSGRAAVHTGTRGGRDGQIRSRWLFLAGDLHTASSQFCRNSATCSQAGQLCFATTITNHHPGRMGAKKNFFASPQFK